LDNLSQLNRQVPGRWHHLP